MKHLKDKLCFYFDVYIIAITDDILYIRVIVDLLDADHHDIIIISSIIIVTIVTHQLQQLRCL